MIQEVGVDLEIKRILWAKARPDYEPLFSFYLSRNTLTRAEEYVK